MMNLFRTNTNIRTLIGVLGVLAATALAAIPAASAAEIGSIEGRVVNGTTVSQAGFDARYPWLVSVQWRDDKNPVPATWGHICGGSLIAPDVVLTAAHCVVWGSGVVPASSFNVLVGRRDLSQANGQLVHVSEIYPDPQYDANGMGEHDAALLQLDAPVEGVTPIDIVGAGDTALWGNGAGLATAAGGPFVAGWGLRWVDPVIGPWLSVSSNEVQEAAIPIIPDTQCVDGGPLAGSGWGRYFDASTMMCAGTMSSVTSSLYDTVDGVTPCFGDSGGPLIVDDGDDGAKLAGIVSFGPFTCASRDVPAVFTRVDAERTFVEGAHTVPVRADYEKEMVIKGDPVVGETMTCGPGTWTGDDITYSYRWYRDLNTSDPIQQLGDGFSRKDLERKPVAGRRIDPDELAEWNNLERIDDADDPTYTAQDADFGYSLLCVVLASNDGWSDFRFSDPSRNVVRIGVSGSARDVRLVVRKARCVGEMCSLLIRVRGPVRSIVRLGGFATRGTKVTSVDGSRENENGRLWSVMHPRGRGSWKTYLWAWDDSGARSPVVSVVYSG